MFKNDDTIAAIATGLSPAGIGIVRISGAEALSIADEIFRNKSGEKVLMDFKSHTIHYGFVYEHNTPIDEVMITVMMAPNSFTREDVVEINCHGGIYLVNKVLRIVLEHGARPAEPGEFSRRAFLNGRIDLTQAEGIMDLISSESEASRISSMEHVRGRLYTSIDELRGRLLTEMSFIEAGIDDPEHIDLDGHSEELKQFSNALSKKLSMLRDTFHDGRLLREGIKAVLCGKPNVGKSSILNYLSNSEAAIVTDIPGTTRDIIEVSIQISEIVMHLTDTAGIHDTQDTIEKIGVDRSIDSLKKADLILAVFDITLPFDKEDEDIIRILDEYNLISKTIFIYNKSDAASNSDINILSPGFSVSAKTGNGFEELKDFIREKFINGEINYNDQVIITNERHFYELSKAINSLNLVIQGIDSGFPIDMVTVDLMDVYNSLSAIIGKNVDDDLINEIFSKFCMGK